MGGTAVALMGGAVFVHGTLRHAPLRAAVLGHARAVGQPAFLPGHRLVVEMVDGVEASWPRLVPDPTPGAGVEGLFIPPLTAEDFERLTYYEAGHRAETVRVDTPAGPQEARLWRAEGPPPPDVRPWDFARWQAEWGETVTIAAAEFMDGFGHVPAARRMGFYGAMLGRAASELRARAPRPARHVHRPAPDDVQIRAVTPAYARFFRLDEIDLCHRRFDGGTEGPLDRACFVSGDAVVVLPYDPVTDRVLVVEQIRLGPVARRDPAPWLLEPIAGRMEARESPETTARRETAEEAGLHLSRLIAAPNYYPTPGAMSEFVYSFVGIADLSTQAPGLGGLDHEAEDIRSHVLSFDELMAAVTSGEVATGTLLVLALWLARERAALRAAAGGAAGLA
ncbi:NUDIX domain-containing protein [Phaeovulum vinaykumarii]|uniref:ADP-ribose pyrophosphatase n=1 Tax=Phaeovulum vinaykumarii TaxID=407234 RepID=A0A1N7L7W0_9RHOB|nr:NUDIX domain-containing protein [Phaeovulum vinaykumarii]SIS69924.1 nudix-type nucleoside diphosphatase, YffH/AdpP family [Phaeovulum vinaykumarii]SOB99239.1 nudix-type nucleoside diphosphatase (YffH/AdpP family) [Phaeovulum vinaykumarii]